MLHYNNLSIEDIEGEVWKQVIGFEDCYMVSNLGRVKNIARATNTKSNYIRHIKERVLRQNIRAKDRAGKYLRVHLSKGGMHKSFNVHRLVAIAFLPIPPKDKSQVNHIFGNTLDNRASELEWCTPSYNVAHGFRVNGRINPNVGKHGFLCHKSKPVIAIDLKSGEETMFESGRLAALKLGIKTTNIYSVLSGKQKTAKNHTFKYPTF